MIIGCTSAFTAYHGCAQWVLRFALLSKIGTLQRLLQSLHDVTAYAFFVLLCQIYVNIEFSSRIVGYIPVIDFITALRNVANTSPCPVIYFEDFVYCLFF
jgi:hypothetical protein